MKRRGRPRTPGLLTVRELEVLDLLRKGLSNREIAERLGITLAGAKFHVSEIIGKLGVTTRDEAVLWRDKLPAVAPAFLIWRRMNLPHVAAFGIGSVALVLAEALLISGLLPHGAREQQAAVTPTTVARPMTLQPKDVSIDQARVLATFPILLPDVQGFAIRSTRYYKLDYSCPSDLDLNNCARVHNDFVEIRYEADGGGAFTLSQGYGGSSGGAYLFAPSVFRGTVQLGDREGHWVRGHPLPGLAPPFAASDWTEDSWLTLSWFESRDVNPTGTDSPRCFSLTTQTMTLDELIAVVRSMPLPAQALQPDRPGC
jgi:DNA-binding CsgD family transcriptional regulator